MLLRHRWAGYIIERSRVGAGETFWERVRLTLCMFGASKLTRDTSGGVSEVEAGDSVGGGGGLVVTPPCWRPPKKS